MQSSSNAKGIPAEFQMNENRVLSSASTPSGGFFNNGSGFYFHKPVMNEIHGGYEFNVLQEMAKHIIPGAEFDSSERDDPPKCHPNTRTRFLKQLQECIHDSSRRTRVIWLVGPAGVGKTAIMQSLAEIVCPLPTLRCATLFFSRPNRRDDHKGVFKTLAYSFAVVDSEYRLYIKDKLSADPGFLNKSLDEQFKRLFISPFITDGVSIGSRRWVVLLDGFDEINGERGQCRVVELIRQFASHTTPFIWIIASRPEAHLRAAFIQVEEEITGFWKLEVPIDSDEALQSMELYLRTEFAKIRRAYSDVVPILWPFESDFLRLMETSSGLFIFASTLVDYIGKEDPVSRLKQVMLRIGQSTADHHDPSRGVKKNPFHALDLLYTMIMSDIPADSLPITKTILAFYLLGPLVTQIHPALIIVCNILGFEQHDTYAALRKLNSVLAFPPPEEAHNGHVKFLHTSFSDFLRDQSRSQSYFIDMDQEVETIWRCCVKIVKLAPEEEFESRIPLSWESSIFPNSTLRLYLQTECCYYSLRIPIEACHDTSCTHKMPFRFLPDTTELVEIFGQFGLRFFEKDISFLLSWLLDHAPATFRQRVILRITDLAQLDEHHLDNMFEGLCRRRWGCFSTRRRASMLISLDDLGITQWERAKRRAAGLDLLQTEFDVWTVLCDLPELQTEFDVDWTVLGDLPKLQKALEARQSRAVRVIFIRLKPQEYYVIIGPLGSVHLLYTFYGGTLEYLIFPYQDTEGDSSPQFARCSDECTRDVGKDSIVNDTAHPALR